MGALQFDDWEQLLESEGLGVIDEVHTTTRFSDPRQGDDCSDGDEEEQSLNVLLMNPERRALASAKAESADLWKDWAQAVGATLRDNRQLHTASTDIKRRQAIWALYAEGKRYNEIATEVNCHRSIVVRTIARIIACSPGAPCANPWRRGTPIEPAPNPKVMAVMLRAIADCADPWLLRERIASDPQLSKLMGDLMPKSPMVRYARIDLMRDLVLAGLPGGRDKAFLTNVDGRPHAGGIDVQGDSVTYTIPWHGIRYAERALEVE